MSITSRFPPQGESIAAMAMHVQRGLQLAEGNGVYSGFGITRNSATQVTITSGVAVDNFAPVNMSGLSFSSLPVASTGYHRYDAIMADLDAGTIVKVPGSQAIPTGRQATPTSWFLENYTPLVPQVPAGFRQIPLYALRITENGLEDVTLGTYCSHGITNLMVRQPRLYITGTGTGSKTIAHGFPSTPFVNVTATSSPGYPVNGWADATYIYINADDTMTYIYGAFL